MSISTKTGDKGKTSLWTGERVWKDNPRVEAYGTIDELNSHLGEAKHLVSSRQAREIIERIQRDLFRVAGQLASKDKLYVQPLHEDDVDRLTDIVHHFEEKVPLTGFVIPGNTIPSAKLDVCRTISRRAERRIITLTREEEVPEPVRKYVNRLSDVLFMLARFEEHLEGKIEFK